MQVKREAEEATVKSETADDSQYKCPVCGKRFMYTFNLGRHMMEQNCAQVKAEERSTRGLEGDVITITDSSDDDGMFYFISSSVSVESRRGSGGLWRSR